MLLMVAPIFASFGLVFNAFGVLSRKPSMRISEVYQTTGNITSTDGKHSAFEWWNRSENYLEELARRRDISWLTAVGHFALTAAAAADLVQMNGKSLHRVFMPRKLPHLIKADLCRVFCICIISNTTYLILGYKVSEVDTLILPVLQMRYNT